MTLLPVDVALEAALGGDAGPLRRALGVEASPAAERRVRALIRRLVTLPAADVPWGDFLAVDRATARLVGTCGFATGAHPPGVVEISYLTLERRRGRGYGFAMACALVELALADPAVLRVRARTRAEPGPSPRILERVGMRRVAEGRDPVEGPVWIWELSRGAGPAADHPAARPPT